MGGARLRSSPSIPPDWRKDLEDEDIAFHPNSCSTSPSLGDTAAGESKQGEQLHVQCDMKVVSSASPVEELK